MILPCSHPQAVVLQGAAGTAGTSLDTMNNIVFIHCQFFTIRLRVYRFIKVVIEGPEVILGGGIEMDLLLLVTLLQEVGGGGPLQAAEGTVVIHLQPAAPQPLPPVLEGEVTEIHPVL